MTGQDQVYIVDPDGSDFNLHVNNSGAGQWSYDGSRITVGNDVLGQTTRPGPLELGHGDITNVLVNGTGLYEGATGTLTESVKLEGSNARPAGTSLVKLSGTIHYDP